MREMNLKQFGKTLREIREQEGLTQEQLAKQSGLTAMHISHYECGRRLPSLENFAAMMRVLGDYSASLLDLDRTPVHVFRDRKAVQ